jgi:outer membrane murein-binding lipoprotein Lpp
MNQTVIILGALASGGVLTALIQGFLGRRKSAADSTDVITQAAERAVQVISSDNTRLRLQVDGLVAQVERLSGEVHALRDQIANLTHENEELLRRLAAWDPTVLGGGT